ncbi:TIGR03087 family PEP-CTERM/XrtA system glycosyltransferase [Sphingomonas gilva]|uniref:TIGR03087 family PEP-CTERM/XrtA system glycosyltransferase n=1 Tax=Sphingomonas gilva TaxID=2305907 RepID=A0A396RN50_9SPHN|nr:TIGR03087 family PEP-CTERM/XrtA system glycosyltransferase [Sphingomonas gilva]RHW17156.1 TIGR03087 family PEP-CTERM/XrtA system glycosyltransferase [Sphingomonas gilva]
MRDLLFLAHRAPFPPDRGDKIRSYHLLRHLAQRWRVHLAAFIEGEDETVVREGLAPFTAGVALVRRTKGRVRAALEAIATGRPVSLAAFDSPALQRAVDDAIAAQDITTAFVFSSQMAHYVDAFSGPIVMDFVDMDSAKFAAYADTARGPMRWMMRREARLLLAHDAGVARRAEASLFVSEAEAALFRSRAVGARIHAVENGIDTDRYDPAIPAENAPHPLIVFTGQMDYRPNIDAVAAFAQNVLPVIRIGHPGAHFAIVGREPAPAVRALAAQDGVIVTGEVPDVRPWLAAADVVVAPLTLARGVQNKVLEAMAMARPVVASPQAAEGIDHDGTIRVAEARGQARAVLDLLADPDTAAALGKAARAQVIARYGWDARLAPLDALMEPAP